MDGEDIAKLVGELEERIERLRVLYDQYFMGIEKIPPEVLKKDVERRMWVLRREKIRNTGTRFKFQTITQRLNTFQSYWMRICRDIENGTYKRDLMRAKRRFGPDATAAQVRTKGPAVEESVPPSAPFDLDVELEELVPDDDGPAGEASERVAATTTPGLRAPPRPPPRVGPPAEPRPATAAGGPNGPSAPRPPREPQPPRVPPDGAAPRARPIEPRPARDDGDLDAMLDAALGAGGAPVAAPRPSTPRLVPAAVDAPKRTIAPATAAARTAQSTMPTDGARARSSAADRSDPDRQIYNKLVDAKRANGESTANLTFEQLQRNLEATRAKLKDKSGGRVIEFDVVVKDGRTILKPTVK